MSYVIVKWRDSCLQNGQVDDDQLPTPSVLETVGWLSRETMDYIVVSRDKSPEPDSFTWRGSIAISKAHVLTIHPLVQGPATPKVQEMPRYVPPEREPSAPENP